MKTETTDRIYSASTVDAINWADSTEKTLWVADFLGIRLAHGEDFSDDRYELEMYLETLLN